MEADNIEHIELPAEVTEQRLPEMPRRGLFPTVIDLIAVLGLFFLSQFITGVVFALFGWSMAQPENLVDLTNAMRRAAEVDMGRTLFLWTIISQPLMLLLVIVYRAVRRGRWRAVRFSARGFNPTVILWGVLMLLSAVVVMEPLMELLPQRPMPEGRGLYMILSLLVVAPICEELLCRGIILEAIRAKWGAWAGCLLSALIFGVMHVEPQFVLNAFVIGLFLGYIYLRTNSIFAPMILHSINNLFAYMFLIFGLSDFHLSDLVGTGALYTIIYVCASAVMLLSLFSMSRRIKRLKREEMASSQNNMD